MRLPLPGLPERRGLPFGRGMGGPDTPRAMRRATRGATRGAMHGAGRPSLRLRLRESTRPLHDDMESRLDLLSESLTLSRYRRVLRGFYGFYAALEPRLSESVGRLPSPLPFPLQPRAPLLERDLVALGSAVEEVHRLPLCPDLPPCESREQLAGCLYVVEGAALGGSVVGPKLESRLGVAGDAGGAFFFGEGTETLARWHCVRDWISSLDAPGVSRDEIVSAACDAFRSLAGWLDAQEAYR